MWHLKDVYWDVDIDASFVMSFNTYNEEKDKDFPCLNNCTHYYQSTMRNKGIGIW